MLKAIVSALLCSLWWLPAWAQWDPGIRLVTTPGSYVTQNYSAGTPAKLQATVGAQSCTSVLVAGYSCTITCSYFSGTLKLKETSPQLLDKGSFGRVSGTRSGPGDLSYCENSKVWYATQTFSMDLLYPVGPQHTLVATLNGMQSNEIKLKWDRAESHAKAPIPAPNPPYAFQDTVLSADVSGYRPTGTVIFIENGVTIASAMVKTAKDNSTTFSATVKFPLGPHTVTASYGGDGNNLASVSGAKPFTAVLHPTSLAAIDEVLNIILID